MITKLLNEELYHYTKYYLGNFDNHFSTIGLVGMNECCLNFIGKDVGSPEGLAFSLEIMHYLRALMIEFQEETGHSYNLEATPAEGTSYRLAKIDHDKYPAIIQSGVKEVYYLSDKYADTLATMASKRMMDSAGVRYIQMRTEIKSITLDFTPEEEML